MSSFTSPLIISPLQDGRRYRIMTPFVYKTKIPSNGRVTHTITVGVGEITDFASIPRFLWCMLPPNGVYGKAAVIHDDLCKKKTFPSHVAHKIFLEGMEVLGVKLWKRNMMYFFVRLFGPRF